MAMQGAETFLRVLDSHDTSTGGGSAAALAGAMAGALMAMVCGLPSNAQQEPADAASAGALAQELSTQLLDGSQQDTLAFQAVRRAHKLPKGTDDERQARQQAIRAAWVDAARVPLDNALRCLRVARLGLGLRERANPAARSDLHCAILLAQAGAQGCLENVAANLPSIRDPAQVSHFAQEADRIRRELASLPSLPPLLNPLDLPAGEVKTQ